MTGEPLAYFATKFQNDDELQYRWKKLLKCHRSKKITDEIAARERWVSDGDGIFWYCGNHYQQISKIEFGQYLQLIYEQFFEDYDEKYSNAAYKILHEKAFIREFPECPHFPFQNGMFNLESGELMPHDPDYYNTAVYPFDYSEERPELFLTTLQEIIPDDADRLAVLQYMRLCMTTDISQKIAQIWLGEGNNGKTVLAEFFARLLGDFAMPFNIGLFSKKPEMITMTRHHRLIICSEIGGAKLNEFATEAWKSMISDTMLQGRGAFEKAMSWVNTAHFIVTSNRLPKLNNYYDKAFFERWRIIRFNEDFTGREDPLRFQRIFQEEGGAVLSYLLRDVPLGPIQKSDWTVVRDFWLKHSSSVHRFIQDACDLDDLAVEDGTTLFSYYAVWCNQTEIESVLIRTFYDELRNAGYRVGHSDKKVTVHGLQYKFAPPPAPEPLSKSYGGLVDFTHP